MTLDNKIKSFMINIWKNLSTSLNGTNFALEKVKMLTQRNQSEGWTNKTNELEISTEVELMEIFEIAGLATIIFGVITTAGLFVSTRKD